MAIEVLYSPEFKRSCKKFSKDLLELFKQKGALFSVNPFHPSLRTHKLSGSLEGLWVFSLDYRHRVIFEFIGKHEVILHSVGDHSIYRDK